MLYSILKSVHLIFLITWFAGLFYIFRLFVYHVENKDKPEVTELFKKMQKKLYYYITWPSFLLTLIAGLGMLHMNPALMKMGWIHAKFLFVVFLIGYHFYAGHIRKAFLGGNFKLTSKQCRLINEVPSFILLVVVPLAILKPF